MTRIIGFFLLVFGFYLLFWVDSKSNDLFWYTRTYTLVEKNQSEHMYKGSSHPDYYFTVRYHDDQNFIWTKSVSGVTYFSQNVGNQYTIRDTRKSYDTANWVILFILLGGCIVFGIGVAKYFD